MKLSFALSSLLILFASEVWALEPCPDNQPKEKWDNCTGTATYTSGKYVGEWKDGKLQGQGTFTFTNGDKYVGGFKDGAKHGQGTYTFASGEKYVGEFKDDKRHGQGTHTFPNGAKYVGEQKDNNTHGQGTWTHGNVKYVGEFKDNNMHGQGTYTCDDGRVYEGRWRKNRLLRQTIPQNCYPESMRLSEESNQLSKQALIAEFMDRCIGFGFKESKAIASCVQQEAFNEKTLATMSSTEIVVHSVDYSVPIERCKAFGFKEEEAIARCAQQEVFNSKRLNIQANSLAAQNVAEAEEVPFLLQMLGEIAIGVSEGYLEKVQHDIMHQNDRRPPIIFNPPKP